MKLKSEITLIIEYDHLPLSKEDTIELHEELLRELFCGAPFDVKIKTEEYHGN